MHRASLNAVRASGAPPRRILDVGCGTGRLLARAAAVFPGAGLAGVDPAAGMVAEAAASLSADVDARFVRGAAERLPFADGSFDLVLSSMSFHHWADQRTALGEVRRVLRPGGIVALADGFAVGLLRLGFRIAASAAASTPRPSWTPCSPPKG